MSFSQEYERFQSKGLEISEMFKRKFFLAKNFDDSFIQKTPLYRRNTDSDFKLIYNLILQEKTRCDPYTTKV